MTFTKSQLITIVKSLEEGKVDKKMIKEYEKKLLEYQNFLTLKEVQVDSLKENNKKCFELTMNYEKIVNLNQKQINELTLLVKDLNEKTNIQENVLKKQKKKIKILTATNLSTIIVIVLLILF